MPLYNELLKNDPGDPFINYYHGACLLKTNKNKAKAINYLESASRYKEVPRDVFLNLGKAFPLSYMFTDALKSCEEYKKSANPATRNEKELNQLITNCKSGNTLMSEQINIQVLRRASVQEDNLPAAYNPEFVHEKLMYKTTIFNSPVDRSKKTNYLCARREKMN